MKLGVVANALQNKPLAEALIQFRRLGIEYIEPGCGGYAGKAHVNPQKLLQDDVAFASFVEMVRKSGVGISVLSCHGNPVHPNQQMAKAYDRDMRYTVLLAEKLGIDTISCFSGCPGDSKESKYPNWVTCAWPDDYLTILAYQWNDVLIPYWKEFTEFANSHGVTKIALEMHPGFCVYNVYTAHRLRDAVGDAIGVTFDPSHLLWQGIDPVMAIRNLNGMIYNVHAKDVRIDPYNKAVNGVLDTRHYSEELDRSWIFRTVGYGNDIKYWKDIFSALRLIGFDGVISIEHEDSLMNQMEGLEKAVRTLKESMLSQERTGMWWA